MSAFDGGLIFAQAPPFETIARRFGANSELLVAAVRGPHPKMNFAPTRRETNDLAAAGQMILTGSAGTISTRGKA
jgi:hypothetical protein